MAPTIGRHRLGRFRRGSLRVLAACTALAVATGLTLGGSVGSALAGTGTGTGSFSGTGTGSLTGTGASNSKVATSLVPEAISAGSQAPQGPYAATLSFTIASISPTVVNSAAGPTLTISGTVTNTSTMDIQSLVSRVQRGAVLADTAALNAEVADPIEPIDSWSDFTAMIPALPAGGSVPFTINAPLYGVIKDTLAITAPGVYPIMININGVIEDFPEGVRVGELHLLLPVTSLPAEIAEANPSTAPAPVPHRVNFVLPLVDHPHRDATGAFLDDELTAAIAEGGRLWKVLDQVEQYSLPSGAVTLAVDPELLEELDLMSKGYFIGPVQFDIAARAAQLDPENFGPASNPASPEATGVPGTGVSGTGVPGTGTTEPANTGAGTSGADTSGAGTSTTPTSAGSAVSGSTAATTATAGATTSAGAVQSPTTKPAPGSTPGAAAASPDSPSATSTNSAATTNETTTNGTTSNETTSNETNPAETNPAETNAPIPADPTTAVTGTGTAVAVAFLDRLRGLATKFPVLVLPYTDPDSVALTRAGLPSFFTEVVARGRLIARDLLGQDAKLVTDVGWPINGIVDDATLAAYQNNGFSSMLLEPAGLGLTADTAPATAMLQTSAGPMNAAIADAGITTGINTLLNTDPMTDPALVTELNLAASQLVVQAQTGAGTSSIFAPAREYLPSGVGYQTVLGLFDALYRDSLITGIPLSEAIKVAGQPATLQYPADAIGAEIPGLAFNQMETTQTEFTDLEAAFSAPPVDQAVADLGPTAPKGLFQPLLDGLYRQAAGGLRYRPALATAMMAPLRDTVTAIQAKVFIITPIGSILLTSSDVPIPVSIRNELPFPVQVRVRLNALDARQAGMTMDDEQIYVVPASNGAGLQVQIPLEINRSGKSVVRASLVGPNGQSWGQPVPFQLTSTAFGTFTLWMIAGAGAVLVMSLALRLRRRWRDRHDRAAKLQRDATLTSAPTSGATTIAVPPHHDDAGSQS